jgi:hypothetical protein
METQKTKQIRSISVDSDIYSMFRTICIMKGLIMSVQFEHMMVQFIEEQNESAQLLNKSTEYKNQLKMNE